MMCLTLDFPDEDIAADPRASVFFFNINLWRDNDLETLLDKSILRGASKNNFVLWRVWLKINGRGSKLING